MSWGRLAWPPQEQSAQGQRSGRRSCWTPARPGWLWRRASAVALRSSRQGRPVLHRLPLSRAAAMAGRFRRWLPAARAEQLFRPAGTPRSCPEEWPVATPRSCPAWPAGRRLRVRRTWRRLPVRWQARSAQASPVRRRPARRRQVGSWRPLPVQRRPERYPWPQEQRLSLPTDRRAWPSCCRLRLWPASSAGRFALTPHRCRRPRQARERAPAPTPASAGRTGRLTPIGF